MSEVVFSLASEFTFKSLLKATGRLPAFESFFSVSYNLSSAGVLNYCGKMALLYLVLYKDHTKIEKSFLKFQNMLQPLELARNTSAITYKQVCAAEEN